MTNRTKQVRRVKRRNNNKDGFIFTNIQKTLFI